MMATPRNIPAIENGDDRNALRVEAVRMLDFLARRDEQHGCGFMATLWFTIFFVLLINWSWNAYVVPDLINPLKEMRDKVFFIADSVNSLDRKTY